MEVTPMKKIKTAMKKVVLSKETVRSLSGGDLKNAVGGHIETPTYDPQGKCVPNARATSP